MADNIKTQPGTGSDPDVRTTEVTGGKHLQHVRLDVGAGTAESQVTAANPLPVTAVISGTGDVNIAEVGGVATSLGQKAEAASIPVVLATEQDVAKTPTITAPNSGPYNGIGCYDYFNEQWSPLLDTSAGSGIPGATIYGSTGGGGVAAVIATNTTPGASDIGLVTRNIPTAPTVTGTITTATSTITLNPIAGYGGVCVSVSGTYTGVNFLLEGSRDGTNWSTISMSRQDSPQIQQSTGVIASVTRQWIAPTLGCIAVRVRATAWVSGTANITINGALAAVPTAVQTIPSGTQTISGAITGAVALTAAKTSGGASHYRNIDLNTTGVLVQTGGTYVSSIEAFNTTAATIYLKIYNKATAATSADTPIKTIPIAAGRERDITSSIGWNIALGYSVRCVTGVADADTTSPAANGCVFSTTFT